MEEIISGSPLIDNGMVDDTRNQPDLLPNGKAFLFVFKILFQSSLVNVQFKIVALRWRTVVKQKLFMKLTKVQ